MNLKNITLIIGLGIFVSCQSPKENTQNNTKADSTQPASVSQNTASEQKENSDAKTRQYEDTFVQHFGVNRYVSGQQFIDILFDFENPEKALIYYIFDKTTAPIQLYASANSYLEWELNGNQMLWNMQMEEGFEGQIDALKITKPSGDTETYNFYRSNRKDQEVIYLRSQNPKNGLIEELKIDQEKNQTWYRSAKNTTWQKLKTEHVSGLGYDVYFANSNKAHHLIWDEGHFSLTCKNPDGTTQKFWITNIY